MTRRGSLRAVGIGIRAPAQTTREAISSIERAERVLTLVADPLAEYWLRSLNPNTESLAGLYTEGKERRQTYREMVARIVEVVREGWKVCAVAYGHPGVAAYPLHESVRQARAERFHAEMLPAVSAEDCLFAEIGVDPLQRGCQSYEATEFLFCRRRPEPTANLVLWQIGAIAEAGYKHESRAWNPKGIAVLTEVLLETYAPEHKVVVYEAARIPPCDSIVERVALARLPSTTITAMSTLFVPAAEQLAVDDAMLERLGVRPRTGPAVD